MPEDDGFHDLLVAVLPRLRVRAWAMTRNRADAADLVQDVVALALRNRHSFEMGTNFDAWVHRILRNRFISLARQRREHVDLEEVPHRAADAVEPAHENRLLIQELSRALALLGPASREALVMVAVQGLSYEEVATLQGCAVGTAKSRVHRARQQLQARLLGEARGSAAAADPRSGAGVPLPQESRP